MHSRAILDALVEYPNTVLVLAKIDGRMAHALEALAVFGGAIRKPPVPVHKVDKDFQYPLSLSFGRNTDALSFILR